MSPPLSQADLDAIGRIVDKKIDARLSPLADRVDKHSGQYREIVPAVMRKTSESHHDLEDRAMGFERFMRDVVNRIEDKVDTVAISIPPAAKAASGAEDAAVAGAKAAIQGANAAIDGKTIALAAKVGAHRALIAQILTALALAIWQLYEHFAKAVSP